MRPDTKFLIKKQLSQTIWAPLVNIFSELLIKLKALNKLQECNPIIFSTCFSGSYWDLIYYYKGR